MRINFNRGNSYFDTYYIYNNEGHLVGIYEDHCRGITKPYFVGWRRISDGKSSGKWELNPLFNTKEEAINFAIGRSNLPDDNSNTLLLAEQ